MASTGPRIGIDEQAGGEAQDQIAVGDSALEDRRGLGRLFVHVGVESVAGEMGEMLDVLERHGAARGLQRVADGKVATCAGGTDASTTSCFGAPSIYCALIAAIIAGDDWIAVRCM